jgi:polyribonucleotide nucleotidyltransferase
LSAPFYLLQGNKVAKFTKSIPYGEHTLTLETGEIARQASAAVMVSMADTVVLVSVVAKKDAVEGRGFFPLTVNYQERGYAAGKVPGGFIKREGRPTENETLVSRLIDRPLRPLFANGFINEVQVIATVLSMNPEVNPDILALIGASAALAIAGIPFDGPVGAARVGYSEGIYQLNPSKTQLTDSSLELIVAGTENATLMVESQANQLSEEIMLGAVMFGHTSMQTVIKAIKELAGEVNNPAWDFKAPTADTNLVAQVNAISADAIKSAYLVRDKVERLQALAKARETLLAQLLSDDADAELPSEASILKVFSTVEKEIVRKSVLSGEPRIDGRDTKTVRPITIRTGFLPRAHGSALFTRGETQAIVVTTLGTESDSQVHDSIHGERKDSFMLHYNFPPYCVGETGMMLSPKRREIGHGNLARRGLLALVPDLKEFPYVLRVVSEITESNGSSSMATVCGTSLALMDAGVPLKSSWNCDGLGKRR